MSQDELFPMEAAPAQERLSPGTLVTCTYRLPSSLQPWIHPVYTGIVEKPNTTPYREGSTYNEEGFCLQCGKTRVRWFFEGFDRQEISTVLLEMSNCLIPVTVEQAQFSRREQIAFFLGDKALANYDKSMGQ